jgi:hypothetical protein
MGPRKRVAGVLLLAPHFLLIVCIAVGMVVSMQYGAAPQGSQAFSIQFVCGVLMVFILPVPSLAGTLAAVWMFQRARIG